MAIGTFIKQPADQLDFDVDFGSEFFEAYGGDAISAAANVTVVVSSGNTGSPNDLVLGPEALPDFDLINDHTVKVWVGGGISGIRYKVTVKAITVGLRTKETDIFVFVKEQ